MTLTTKEFSSVANGDGISIQAAGGALFLTCYYSPTNGVYIHQSGSFPLNAKSTRALAAKLNEWAGRMDELEKRR